MNSRPAVGSTVRYTDGHDYVIAYYPTANLDSLGNVVMARRVGRKRAGRLLLSDCTSS